MITDSPYFNYGKLNRELNYLIDLKKPMTIKYSSVINPFRLFIARI